MCKSTLSTILQRITDRKFSPLNYGWNAIVHVASQNLHSMLWIHPLKMCVDSHYVQTAWHGHTQHALKGAKCVHKSEGMQKNVKSCTHRKSHRSSSKGHNMATSMNNNKTPRSISILPTLASCLTKWISYDNISSTACHKSQEANGEYTMSISTAYQPGLLA